MNKILNVNGGYIESYSPKVYEPQLDFIVISILCEKEFIKLRKSGVDLEFQIEKNNLYLQINKIEFNPLLRMGKRVRNSLKIPKLPKMYNFSSTLGYISLICATIEPRIYIYKELPSSNQMTTQISHERIVESAAEYFLPVNMKIQKLESEKKVELEEKPLQKAPKQSTSLKKKVLKKGKMVTLSDLLPLSESKGENFEEETVRSIPVQIRINNEGRAFLK